MSDFPVAPGFEDVWRPVAPPRVWPKSVLDRAATPVRDRLGRVVARSPEVVATVKGTLKTPLSLRQHLDYVSRKGALELEERDGGRLRGRDAVRELAEDWSWAARADSRDYHGYLPIALSMVLSMPRGPEPALVRDAARAFAHTSFGERFDFAFVLHTDAQPHVHLCVRSLGDDGQRLRHERAELAMWRQVFAAALRDRGVEAEATPRRARGIVHQTENSRGRRVRLEYEAGEREMGFGMRRMLMDAARDAVDPPTSPRAWEAAIAARQGHVRGLYLAQAELLKASPSAQDRALGEAVERFVRDMPAIETQREQIARLVRAEMERKLTKDLERQRQRER